jgi:predicted nucleotidyltransferase
MNIGFESRLVEAYKSHLRDDLISIVIFGSRARRDYTENSDFDILIIAAHLPERYLARIGYIREPLFKFDEKVQVLSKTPDEFDSFFPPLYLDIALDGKILMDRDGFMENRLRKIKNIIKDSSLYRIKAGNEFL